ncbi:MAG: V-type ATP synthase subunit D [Pseudomonadota bacterium]|nr:V-type ATP synthase subunit D [Pseudomonadota bacterium]
MIGPEQAPTRAAVLELRQERSVVSEAYEFLDEKRLLLAAELLRQLEAYQRLQGKLESLARQARRRLAAAVERHGLQGLSVYPAALLEGVRLDEQRRNFMGVTLVETELLVPESQMSAPRVASNPSTEAEACRKVFADMIQHSAVLAGLSGNLHRLLEEYRLTERRARALENVILPEIEQSLNEMMSYLDEVDLEDAIRARLQRHEL